MELEKVVADLVQKVERRFFLGRQFELKFRWGSADTMRITTHGGNPDGTYDPSSTPDCDTNPQTAPSSLPDVRRDDVGGVP